MDAGALKKYREEEVEELSSRTGTCADRWQRSSTSALLQVALSDFASYSQAGQSGSIGTEGSDQKPALTHPVQ